MRAVTLGVRMLLVGSRSALACGSCESCCSCCLRECSEIRRCLQSLRMLVRIILDKVVDVIEEIRVGLPVAALVAVLLIQILICTESQC
jgi:hypothetical protein